MKTRRWIGAACRICAALLAAAAWTGCGKPCGATMVESPSFVVCYYEPGSLITRSASDGDSPYVIVGYDFDKGVSMVDQGKEAERYRALCVKHGDEGYNRKVQLYFCGEFFPQYSYCSVDFTALTLTSDRDFDADHPAGMPLDDVVQFMGMTPYPFIRSGYRDRFDWGRDCPDELLYRYWTSVSQDAREASWPVYKRVSELTPVDMILLGGGNQLCCILTFPVAPERPGEEHTLTLTLTGDNGRVYTGEVKVTL